MSSSANSKTNGKEEDVEDYMADGLLEKIQAIAEKEPTSLRLLTTAGKKRKTDESTIVLDTRISVAERMSTSRTAGLDRPIEKGNIGHQLLIKMGYKAGTSLGRTGEGGLLAPLPLTLKETRTGLGKDTATLKEVKEKDNRTMEDFTRRQRQKLEEAKINKDLRMANSTIVHLEEQNGKIKPEQSNNIAARDSIDNTLDDFESTHSDWASKRELDSIEEEKSAVGESKKKSREEIVEINSEEEEKETQLSPAQQLYSALLYLRKEYCYCLYCGIQYKNGEEMEAQCPGVEREEHD